MIDVKQVSKYYSNNKKAVDDLSFSVRQGELFGFLGPNGAGKTTTIRMMIGLLQPTEGEITINNLSVQRNKKQVQEDIGVVFELPNLYLRSSIRDNLKLFGDLHNVSNARIDEVLDSLQLLERQNDKVSSLSKGWKQRVLIARALLHQPKVLFLDEPTSGLDPNTTALIRGFINNFKQEGTTIVLTTHDMHEADELCDRVGIMCNGKLAALDDPSKLKSTHGKRELQVEYNRDGLAVKETWPVDDVETAKSVYQLMSSQQMISMHTKEASLGDVFAVLTGSELS
ncbi:ABC-2 type transport system ATP-binding protein [Paenibacillus anaericanus]|uniref:ABC transporter ATP-binding protein n=1 Tax=Paenibacillus anaericanus TaxID=170367 RepID=UPI002789552F|nr:ABC transporter ATP-binding protein [Paenibacillus anaericanus]MDQ0088715.1 ABC-2 type transport system ATP-binding protein [Paenibacillus anaericanus]